MRYGKESSTIKEMEKKAPIFCFSQISATLKVDCRSMYFCGSGKMGAWWHIIKYLVGDIYNFKKLYIYITWFVDGNRIHATVLPKPKSTLTEGSSLPEVIFAWVVANRSHHELHLCPTGCFKNYLKVASGFKRAKGLGISRQISKIPSCRWAI